MPRQLIDLVGQRFGRLTVVAHVGSDKKSSTWLMRCDCGTEKVLPKRNFASPNSTTKSCGCLQWELRRRKRKQGGA